MSHGSIFQSTQLVIRVYITIQGYEVQNDRADLFLKGAWVISQRALRLPDDFSKQIGNFA